LSSSFDLCCVFWNLESCPFQKSRVCPRKPTNLTELNSINCAIKSDQYSSRNLPDSCWWLPKASTSYGAFNHILGLLYLHYLSCVCARNISMCHVEFYVFFLVSENPELTKIVLLIFFLSGGSIKIKIQLKIQLKKTLKDLFLPMKSVWKLPAKILSNLQECILITLDMTWRALPAPLNETRLRFHN